MEEFSDTLVLRLSQVRLARNLLQTVIRNWYAREPTIISCFAQLRQLGVKAAGAMLQEDIQMLGSCIDHYWELKKMVASGCEPTKVRTVYSHSLLLFSQLWSQVLWEYSVLTTFIIAAL